MSHPGVEDGEALGPGIAEGAPLPSTGWRGYANSLRQATYGHVFALPERDVFLRDLELHAACSVPVPTAALAL